MSKSVPHLSSILRDFPSVRFAFAYGSGVFQQPGRRAGGKLLDFIFAVDNPRDWHTKVVRLAMALSSVIFQNPFPDILLLAEHRVEQKPLLMPGHHRQQSSAWPRCKVALLAYVNLSRLADRKLVHPGGVEC